MDVSQRQQGLLLVGHGTREETGTREFFELTSVLCERLSPIAVEGCLLEFQHPTIPEAWQTLVRRGVTQIHVAPLLLFAAGHARADIPEIIDKCAARSSGIVHHQSGPLSRAPSIVDLSTRRIREVAAKHQIELDDDVALVMVGRGSRDPCATADMLVLGEIVAYRLGCSQHRVGFYAMADPKLPGVLDEMAGRLGIRTVIVQPHLLFQGRLFEAIVGQVEDASRRHPGIRFLVGDYLGPTAEIAEALVRRTFPTTRG